MKKPLTKNKWFWGIIVVIALAALGNILGLYEDKEPQSNAPVSQVDTIDNSISYEIVTSDNYGVGLKSHSYRVIIDENATDDQLLWVLSELDDRKYEEVTIWFYKSKSSVENGAYDVAMIERTGSDSPKITR